MKNTVSQEMKSRFFDEAHELPECVNDGCNRKVLVREWKYWSFKSECSRCTNARKKGLKLRGVTIHKKEYCENYDGHLGFICPVDSKCWSGFLNSLDLDHLDGDHHNNMPENVKTYCKLCHGKKSLENGDCNRHKGSSRVIG